MVSRFAWLDESVDSTLEFAESKGVFLVADPSPHLECRIMKLV